MKCKGYEVHGADICRNYVNRRAFIYGITAFDEHDEKNVKDSDFVVASTAIERKLEYAYSKKNNKKILKRGELLAILQQRNRNRSGWYSWKNNYNINAAASC